MGSADVVCDCGGSGVGAFLSRSIVLGAGAWLLELFASTSDTGLHAISSIPSTAAKLLATMRSIRNIAADARTVQTGLTRYDHTTP